jgi:hypothetical protein
LVAAGYDALHLQTATAEPGQPALVVSGVFRHIYEGHRRENARAVVAVTVDYQPASGRRRRLASFNLDSRRLGTDPHMPMAGRHGHNANYEVTRLGIAIARRVADLARVERWPGSAR